jgi:hypothetical protein
MVVYICNLSFQEAEAGVAKFEDRMEYIPIS